MSDDFSVKKLGVQAYWKWLSLTLISTALSAAGLIGTISNPDRRPLIFVASASWIIVLIVSALSRDFLIRMDPRRFRFAGWEQDGRFYDNVGIAAFHWLLLHTFLGWLSPTLKLSSSRSGVERLLREMNFAEGVHLIAGLITLGLAGGSLGSGHEIAGLYFFISAIVLHAYPLMLQRWNRGRIARMLHRIDSQSETVRSC
ncbi:MAG: hypothetical protein GC154_15445 [bacterium]|nr:hypothetical protein [bacterium]